MRGDGGCVGQEGARGMTTRIQGLAASSFGLQGLYGLDIGVEQKGRGSLARYF